MVSKKHSLKETANGVELTHPTAISGEQRTIVPCFPEDKTLSPVFRQLSENFRLSKFADLHIATQKCYEQNDECMVQ